MRSCSVFDRRWTNIHKESQTTGASGDWGIIDAI